LGVSVLLADMDTLHAIEVVEGLMGRSRVQEPQKVRRFTALLNDNLDFPMLYDKLGIKVK
jgi:BioD-like phosphotransacetylase family protein